MRGLVEARRQNHGQWIVLGDRRAVAKSKRAIANVCTIREALLLPKRLLVTDLSQPYEFLVGSSNSAAGDVIP